MDGRVQVVTPLLSSTHRVSPVPGNWAAAPIVAVPMLPFLPSSGNPPDRSSDEWMIKLSTKYCSTHYSPTLRLFKVGRMSKKPSLLGSLIKILKLPVN